MNWDAVWLGTLIAGGLAIAGGVGRAIWKRNLMTADPISQLARAQNRFQFAVEDLVRHPRRFSQSITEFTAKHEEKLGPAATPSQELARRFERAFFSPDQVTSETVTEIVSQANAVGKQLAEVKKTLGRSRPR